MTLPGQGFPQLPTLSTLGDVAWTQDPSAGRMRRILAWIRAWGQAAPGVPKDVSSRERGKGESVSKTTKKTSPSEALGWPAAVCPPPSLPKPGAPPPPPTPRGWSDFCTEAASFSSLIALGAWPATLGSTYLPYPS